MLRINLCLTFKILSMPAPSAVRCDLLLPGARLDLEAIAYKPLSALRIGRRRLIPFPDPVLDFMMLLTILPNPRSRARRSARLSVLRASSATSLRQRFRRSGSSVPASSAARTAQPGSVSCRQSENRAGLCQGDDVGEYVLEARFGVGQLQLAHARRIQQPSVGRQPV